MTGRPLVDILLATWNGEKYLAAQIESLLAQSFSDWRLLARDDGSSDTTKDILRRYAAEHPRRIEIIDDGEEGLGACGNFARLLERSDADYVMFCDQHDVWLPHKVEQSVAAIRRLEAAQEPGRPAMVHCDLRVVDRNLSTVAPSFWRYQKLNPVKGRSLNRLLIQNVVTGCAATLNRPLARLATPIPPEARMHDWWVALVAAAFGRVECISEPLVLYRQHGDNTLGAKNWSLRGVTRLLTGGNAYKAVKAVREVLRDSERQAAVFVNRYGVMLKDKDRRLVQAYASIFSLGVFARRIALLHNGFLPGSIVKNLGLLIVA